MGTFYQMGRGRSRCCRRAWGAS